MRFPETVDPLTVSCPDCLAKKNDGCTYLWPMESDGTPKVPRSWHGAGIRAQIERAGKPTKRPHLTRYQKANIKAQVQWRKQQNAKWATANAASLTRASVLRANADAVRTEQQELITWLSSYADILIGADR